LSDRKHLGDSFGLDPDTIETADLGSQQTASRRAGTRQQRSADDGSDGGDDNPRMVGPYILEDHLARGGMGDVWKARREGPGGYLYRVALKRLHPHLVSSPEQNRMFLREARLGSRLYHPNIVPVIDVAYDDGAPYLVMELVEGVDLRRLSSRGETLGEPIPPPLAGYIMHQALWALEAAHNLTDERGDPAPLVHRDISPENILIGRYGDVRVADFGIAKQLRIGESLTRVGQVKGKFAYMSPEQLQGRDVDGRSDLYAVGITFYELLCGRRPYEARTLSEALKDVEKAARHPLELRPHLPRALADLAFLWRHPDPDLRGESVAVARKELAEVLESQLTGVPNIQLARWVASITSEELAGIEGRKTALQGSRRPCAKCGGKLIARETVSSVVMDVCRDCHGIWLDRFELVRILGDDLALTDPEAVFNGPKGASALDEVVGDCPCCHQQLKAHQVPGEPPFHIEQCDSCRGLWFDAGELERFVKTDIASMVRKAGGLDLG